MKRLALCAAAVTLLPVSFAVARIIGNRDLVLEERGTRTVSLAAAPAGTARTQTPQDRLTPPETPPVPNIRPPRIVVPEAKIPIRLTEANLNVTVTGPLARATMTLTFRNDNDRILEGELDFPLPEGAVVSGYGLDVNGELVDGVPVEKRAARVAFEKEVRRGVDPGIVENVGGNNFRTRIYPLPAKGTRTVKVEYIADLMARSDGQSFTVPLNWGQEVPLARVRVEVQQNPVKPVLRFGGRDRDLFFEAQGAGYVAEKTFENIRFADDLTVALPGTSSARQIAVERFTRATAKNEETFFVVSDSPTVPAPPPSPLGPMTYRVGIVWDASLSRKGADHKRELAVLEKHLRSLGNTGTVTLLILRHQVEARREFLLGADGIASLLKAIQETPLDGGTNMGALNLTGQHHWLVFTDGNGNLGDQMPAQVQGQVYPIASDSTANHPLLRALANRTGGAYLNLARITDEEAQASLRAQPFSLLSVKIESGRVADVFPNGRVPVQGRVNIAGRLLSDEATVTLNYGYGEQVMATERVTLKKSDATATGLVPRFWARQRVDDLAVEADENGEALLAVGRDFNIVTPNASLIVLESLQQYLEHEITPPASRKTIYAAYIAEMEKRSKVEKTATTDKTNRLVALWRDRVNWHDKTFQYAKNFKYRDLDKQKAGSGRGRNGFTTGMDGVPAGVAMGGGAAASRNANAYERPPAYSTLAPIRVAPRPAASPAPADQVAFRRITRTESPLAEAKKDSETDLDTAAAAPAVVLKEWTPDTPYLKAMQAVPATKAYEVYLTQREKFGESPAFYLDCAEHLAQRGQKELAPRVLTNLAELRLEDPALLRILAHRLAQTGYRNTAIFLFEKVQKLRPEEPQSFRDLALVLADRADEHAAKGRTKEAIADYNRALDLLHTVVMGKWDRFEEIETIALVEVNRIVTRAKTLPGTSAAALKVPFDSRLLRNLDGDVRILLTWDADQTDMDLWITEPSGEKCDYSHNRTVIGGRMSKDFTDGYGPEEYIVRKAMPGTYRIQTNYYGSGQQRLTGGTTVQATVITNFGRPNEKRQYMTLRLNESKETVDVGEITWKQP
jgi:tetratricopeptide (TPR) repeat protein